MRIPFRRRRFRVWFYNLKVGRSPRQVARELRAIAANRPHVIGVVEAIGYNLPQLMGYVLIRDTSTPGRENVAAYVRADLEVTRIMWHDLETEWRRWHQRPRTAGIDMHPARAWLEFDVGHVQTIVGHQPPQHIKDRDGKWCAVPAQAEGIDLLERRMAPWKRDPEGKRGRKRPRVAMADYNRRPGVAGPGPTELADRINGRVIGAGIDVAVVRRAWVWGVRYPSVVNGVTLLSDHRQAFKFTMSVPAKWLA